MYKQNIYQSGSVGNASDPYLPTIEVEQTYMFVSMDAGYPDDLQRSLDNYLEWRKESIESGAELTELAFGSTLIGISTKREYKTPDLEEARVNFERQQEQADRQTAIRIARYVAEFISGGGDAQEDQDNAARGGDG